MLTIKQMPSVAQRPFLQQSKVSPSSHFIIVRAKCSEALTTLAIRFVSIVLLTATLASFAQSQVPTIATGQYDNNRTGANLNETQLNTSNVNVAQFGKIASLPLDGREYGNPLFIPNVSIPVGGGKSRVTNVLYLATQKNTIFAFDANSLSTTPIWQTNLGAPVAAQSAEGGFCPAFSGGNELGILSTPVIDTSTNTLYAVSTSPTSSGTAYQYFLNALDIATGQPRVGSPVQIQASVPGSGYDNIGGMVSLNQDTRHAQRTALLLSKGNVYMGFASCGPDADPWHGWLFSYNASNLSRNWAFNTTPDDMRGGIWQSGFGPVDDAAGNVYVATANGDPNSPDPYSNSVLMLSPAGIPTAYQFTNWSQLSTDDLDISSAGLIRVPNTSYLLSGGKMGLVGVVSNSGGSLNLQQLFQATNACPVPITSDATCHEMHGDAFWSDGGSGGFLYVWGSSATDPLNAFRFANGVFSSANGGPPSPSSQNTSVSLGTKSAALAVSANHNQVGTGILWVNAQTTLYAFDASNVATQLWNNSQNSTRDGGFQFTHWVEPIVAQGRVYLPWYSNDTGGVAVFGLLPTSPVPDFSLSVAPASQNVVAGNSTTYSVSITPANNFSGTVSLSLQGLPPGAIGTFNPASITGTNTSTLAISTGSTTPLGSDSLTLTATSGTLSHTAIANLILTSASSSGIQVSLAPIYNRVGIVTDGKTFSGGLDRDGDAYSSNLLGNSLSYNNLLFTFGPPDVSNAVSNGATIPLPAGLYSSLTFLGSAVNGTQKNQVFTVNYSDSTTQTFSQTLSDWHSSSTSKNASGETTVLGMPYRDTYSGGRTAATYNLYAYSLTPNSTKSIASLTLPNNSDVVLLAVTLTPSTTSAVSVPMGSLFNRNAIVTDAIKFSNSGVDRDGNSYSSTLLGASLSFNGSSFTFGPVNELDAVSNGALIPLPAGQFSKVNMLATGVNGVQKSQSFIVTYTDGSTTILTQGLSNWVPAGNQAGETTVLTMPYADVYIGTQKVKPVAVYGYSFVLNPAKTVQSFALPANPNVVVLGLSLLP